MTCKKKAGFTLIELLVVISIIGVLAALTLSGVTAARKNSRDVTRKSDLTQYRQALEAYAGNNVGKYPGSAQNGVSNPVASGIFVAAGPIIVEYLPNMIPDPAPSAANFYQYAAADAAGTDFVLSAALESGNFFVICSATGASGVTAARTTCPTP